MRDVPAVQHQCFYRSCCDLQGAQLRDLKRFLDLFGAVMLLLLFSPLLAIIAVLVAIRLGRPVLFRQQRAGLGGKPFEMVKFRTMTEARGSDGELLPDAVRLTTFGEFLRRTSLDELPELWNVVKGEMSLVGPRPLLVRYLERYSREQARRHEVLPGMTGWAQVNGRNAVDWEDRLAMDVWYVDNRSLALDFRIVGKTIGVLLNRKGVSAEGHATMREFLGSKVDV